MTFSREVTQIDPIEGVWCDDTRALDDARAILRLPANDIDIDRLTQAVATACQLISAFLARETDVVGDPPALRTAHAYAAVEVYRRKDAPFGVLNAWSPDEIVTHITTDPLRQVYHLILPFKQGFGVAG